MVLLSMKKPFQFLFYLNIVLCTTIHAKKIYDFNKEQNIRDWQVVDDVVMGGRSLGSFTLDENGNGLFNGFISLDNYGGFSSIRLWKEEKVDNYQYIVMKVFGDNKLYQLRIRSSYYDRHVYVKEFFAKNEWSEIKIALNSMQPQFRGRKLRMRNFNSDSIVEIGILIGNKVEEKFSLLIDYISLK